jgi:hypothetical protein
MKNRKAQLKIQEMSFMLLALMIFFIFVGLFAFTIFYAGMYKSANKAEEDKVISAIVRLSDSPELICTGFKTNCVDSDKAISLMNRKTYSNYWPFSSLYILKFNSFNKSSDKLVDCTISNYPNCDRINIYDKGIKNQKLISSFISLCRSEYENGYYERCELAKLVGGSEIKNEK